MMIGVRREGKRNVLNTKERTKGKNWGRRNYVLYYIEKE